jgi:Glycine/serine hydroxymethyltransferase
MSQRLSSAINAALVDADPAISGLIGKERERQETHLELIASENFASRAVMEAQGSVLTNKYAEGLPHQALLRRVWSTLDAIEELAIARAKRLFGAAGQMWQPPAGPRQLRGVLGLLSPAKQYGAGT